MTHPVQDFNQARAARATSNRDFALGPYTMRRRVSVPPEVVIDFRATVDGNVGDERVALNAAETVIAALCEPVARDATGADVSFADAWSHMRSVGDENGVIDSSDIIAISRWLIEGVVERPTVQPSNSSDGLETPPSGMPSTGGLLSPEHASMISTPAGLVMPSTPV